MIRRGIKRIFLIVFLMLLITSTFSQFAAAIGMSIESLSVNINSSPGYVVTSYWTVHEGFYSGKKIAVKDGEGGLLGYYRLDFIADVKVEGWGMGDGAGNDGEYLGYDLSIGFMKSDAPLDAYGRPLIPWKTVAADPSIPKGTKVTIKSLGSEADIASWVAEKLLTTTFVVSDRGPSVKGHHIDVYVGDQTQRDMNESPLALYVRGATVGFVSPDQTSPVQHVPPEGGLTVSCFGDSVTHSYPYGDHDPLQAIEKTYPLLLQSKLDNQFGEGYFTLVNHGINGFKAEDLRTNLPGWLNENPAIALVMIGGNDLSAASTVREFMRIAQETVGEVQDCVDIIKAHVNPDGQRPMVIVSAFIPNRLGRLANWGIKYYNSLLENQLTNIDLFFSNNFEDLYDSTAGQAKSELMYDLVHPNDAGYEVIAENWYKVVAYVPGEVIVGFKGSADHTQITRLIEDKRGKVIRQLNHLNAVVAKVNEKRVEAFMKGMRENSLVRYVERNGRVMSTLTPNDPGWSDQWGPKKIQADTAWNTQTGDKSILVAVVDTGVDWNHPDLAANYVPLGYDWWNYDSDPMDDHGHGTHCAGIIAAVLNNGRGMAGLAQVRVMAEKFLSSGGWGTFADAASALRHAADAGADIISNSWGAYYDSTIVHEAVRYAYNKGALLVAAAGNDWTDQRLYPAAYDEVVAVTATDQSDNPAWFTNFGSWVEVAAPGVSIYSTVWDDSYASWSGTSMATPHVAGVVALIWSQFPGMTRDQVRARLRDKADDLGDPGFDIYYGYGRVNARKAVGTSPPSAPSGLTATAVSSSQIDLAWTDNSNDESDFHIERKEGSGETWSEISTVGANTVSHQDTGLSPSTTYHYRVRAHRHSDSLYSGYSNEASATTQTPPSGAYALSFDGSNDYVSVSHDASLEPPTITVEAWIKFNSVSEKQIIVQKRKNYAGYFVRLEGGKIEFYVYTDGWHAAVSSLSPTTGVWYHIAGVYNQKKLKLYINRRLDGRPVSATGDIASSKATLTIGRTSPQYANQYHLNGIIDEVRIYSRALSPAEVSEHYQGIYTDETGLVLHLNFDGDATDQSGNGNHGTIHDATWAEGHGKSPYALSFDGSNDYVSVFHDASLEPPTITVEAWIKFNSVSEKQITLQKRTDHTGYFVRLEGGKIEFYVYTDGWHAAVSSLSPTTGVWYHIVGVYDQQTVTLYIDGSANGNPASTSGDITTSGATLTIGRTSPQYANQYYLDGIIDEVRIYSRALSPAEVGEHYQGIYTDETGLVLHLDFDGDATDQSGNGNHGTIHDATWVSTS